MGFAPGGPGDVVAWLPEQLALERLLARLAGGEARLRPDLVGDVGQAGGSGGQYGRFVELGAEFLKSSTRRRFATADEAIASDQQAERLRSSLGIYHPARAWFVSRGSDEAFWVCSLTPRLEVLRERFHSGQALAWQRYLEAIELCFKVGVESGLWLDCNPNNFGELAGGLYYLDDDLSFGSATTLALQALLRLREHATADLALREGFLRSFSELALAYAQHPPVRQALYRDLTNEVLWPREAELRSLVQGLLLSLAGSGRLR
ncbi:MAG: hypothetical protein U0002_13515 [Thermoanaerobaculia bacterium]